MSDNQGPRLLVVDDGAASSRALLDALRQAGYETVGVRSAKEALAALRGSRFDLLLADLTMPEMDGVDLLRAAAEIDADLVGVLMTPMGTLDAAVAATPSGALDYLLKPFRLPAVLTVISRAIGVRRLRLANAALEQNLRRRTAELETANREFEGFAFSVSHDLRAPLRAVDGFAAILDKDFSAQMPPEARRLLGKVRANSRRMEGFIEDLLRYSRLSREPMSRQSVNVASMVREIVDELQAAVSGTGRGHVSVHLDRLPDCVGDRALLRQMFHCLLSNALKFTRYRESGAVTVGGREAEGERIYEIRDNGAGFDMRYADRLFGVFQRLHAADEFEGNGIGLSIVQRIVHRHGGRVWAEAEVDRGATFHVALPQ